MLNSTVRDMLIKIIRDLNDNGAAGNREYLRGQIELAMQILGYSNEADFDGFALRNELMATVTA